VPFTFFVNSFFTPSLSLSLSFLFSFSNSVILSVPLLAALCVWCRESLMMNVCGVKEIIQVCRDMRKLEVSGACTMHVPYTTVRLLKWVNSGGCPVMGRGLQSRNRMADWLALVEFVEMHE